MVCRTFSIEICKKANYSVQILEKWRGSVRTSRGDIDLAEVFLRGKRERELVLKLRTVHSYAPNKKGDICEDKKNVKRFKSEEGIIWKLFLSLHRLFQMDQTYIHGNFKRNI